MANDQSVTGTTTAERTGPVPAIPRADVPGTWGENRAPEARTPASYRGIEGLDGRAGETIFEVMVATMWSDGELTTPEVERGRAAARCMKINPRRRGAFGAIAEGALPFTDVDFEALDPSHRRLAHAAAAWIDDANDAPSERRSGFLRALQTRLELADEADDLRALVRAVDREHPEPESAFTAMMLALVAAEQPEQLD